jgi:hypothetical protein
VTERLQKCIDAGEVVELFPLLKEWPEDELKALVNYCGKLHEEFMAEVGVKYKEAVFKPENFFNQTRAKALDEAKKEAFFTSLAICSEVSYVAQFYLERMGKPLKINNDEAEV